MKLQFHPRANLDDTPTFKFLYVCFEAIKTGFLEGCRPFIGVDGCFLKGPYGGVMLSAVSLDGNRGILPIAFAIVDSECTESWKFFMDCLHQCIGSENKGIPYTFMSDRQKVSHTT